MDNPEIPENHPLFKCCTGGYDDTIVWYEFMMPTKDGALIAWPIHPDNAAAPYIQSSAYHHFMMMNVSYPNKGYDEIAKKWNAWK